MSLARPTKQSALDQDSLKGDVFGGFGDENWKFADSRMRDNKAPIMAIIFMATFLALKYTVWRRPNFPEGFFRAMVARSLLLRKAGMILEGLWDHLLLKNFSAISK